MATDNIGKWAAGVSYGPVLSQTDLYLLNTELEVNPILDNKDENFHLIFNISTGQTGGFNENSRDRLLEFTGKDQPATLPRVQQLVIITDISPWCTIVQNQHGITMKDVCTAMWKEYAENLVTHAELDALAPWLQERVKRAASRNLRRVHFDDTRSSLPRRVDWLMDRIFFDGLRNDKDYALARLGFTAPNVFVMHLVP
ncbi:hypothetical protein R3P38DRAFT_3628997 [Favolaschia claudopus]|uniref:DUF6699 domain-containing protein n=1 Tax=Favolaschia claudopus TaxID=2862362 RepID=A0AAV9ZZ83_9AGAR